MVTEYKPDLWKVLLEKSEPAQGTASTSPTTNASQQPDSRDERIADLERRLAKTEANQRWLGRNNYLLTTAPHGSSRAAHAGMALWDAGLTAVMGWATYSVVGKSLYSRFAQNPEELTSLTGLAVIGIAALFAMTTLYTAGCAVSEAAKAIDGE